MKFFYGFITGVIIGTITNHNKCIPKIIIMDTPITENRKEKLMNYYKYKKYGFKNNHPSKDEFPQNIDEQKFIEEVEKRDMKY